MLNRSAVCSESSIYKACAVRKCGVNEQFSDKRNAANGTLWTDTTYKTAF